MSGQEIGSAKKNLPYHNALILHKSKKQTVKDQLELFRNHNILLLDLVSFPIDCFVPSTRIKFVKEYMPEFIKRFSSLDLAKFCNKIVILPSSTYEELYKKKHSSVLRKLEDRNFNIIKWSETEKTLKGIASDLGHKNIL